MSSDNPKDVTHPLACEYDDRVLIRPSQAPCAQTTAAYRPSISSPSLQYTLATTSNSPSPSKSHAINPRLVRNRSDVKQTHQAPCTGHGSAHTPSLQPFPRGTDLRHACVTTRSQTPPTFAPALRTDDGIYSFWIQPETLTLRRRSARPLLVHSVFRSRDARTHIDYPPLQRSDESTRDGRQGLCFARARLLAHARHGHHGADQPSQTAPLKHEVFAMHRKALKQGKHANTTAYSLEAAQSENQRRLAALFHEDEDGMF
ncbi:hypothetical protein VTO73DRAFT_12957 [Trametes versicolor]